MASVESFRVLAIFAVILWHSGFVAQLSRSADGNLLVVLTGYLVWWVAVPYFFIAAGYFFRHSVLKGEHPISILRGYVAPLAWMLVVWLGISIVTPPNWPFEVVHHGVWQTFYTTSLNNMQLLVTQNITLFLHGDRPVWHLWFLPALVVSMTTLTMIAMFRLQRYLVPLIISLYVLILTEESVAGYFHSDFHVRAWLGAILLTTIGWWLAERAQPTMRTACGLIVGGYAVALLEGMSMSVLLHGSKESMLTHFYLGGATVGVGIFLLALAKPDLGRSTPFPFLARFTLGVYVSHVFVMYTLSTVLWRVQGRGPLGSVAFALIVYVCSVLFTFALTKIPVARYAVMKPTWETSFRHFQSFRAWRRVPNLASGRTTW